jgi:hypothetical protein
VSVWDWSNRVDQDPAASRVDVVLGDRIAVARRFDPVASEAEQQRWDNPSRIPIDVGGAPVVLRLDPAGAAAGGGAAPGGGPRKAVRRPACASKRSAHKRKSCCRAVRHRIKQRHRAQHRHLAKHSRRAHRRPRAQRRHRAQHRHLAKQLRRAGCVSPKRPKRP